MLRTTAAHPTRACRMSLNRPVSPSLPSPTIISTLDAYDEALRAQKRRKRGIATYLADLRRFAVWLGPHSTVADITAARINAYQSGRAHLSGATLGKMITSLRSYSRWCIRERLRSDDPTEGMVRPQREEVIPRALTDAELRGLEAALASPIPVLDRKRRRLRMRDQLAVLLMLYAGLRRAEVVGILWSDIDLDARMLTVRREVAKGGRPRVIPLHDRIVAELINVPQNARRGAVCGHKNGNSMSHKSIGWIFERWLYEEHGLDISAHQLRHTFATRLLRNGADLATIQRLLGHASLATTQLYLRIEDAQKREAVALLPHRFN